MDVGNLRLPPIQGSSILFNKPPPTGASEFLSLIAPSSFLSGEPEEKKNQNRVRTPGQEKRMELEELELEQHQTLPILCAETERARNARFPNAWCLGY